LEVITKPLLPHSIVCYKIVITL